MLHFLSCSILEDPTWVYAPNNALDSRKKLTWTLYNKKHKMLKGSFLFFRISHRYRIKMYSPPKLPKKEELQQCTRRPPSQLGKPPPCALIARIWRLSRSPRDVQGQAHRPEELAAGSIKAIRHLSDQNGMIGVKGTRKSGNLGHSPVFTPKTISTLQPARSPQLRHVVGTFSHPPKRRPFSSRVRVSIFDLLDVPSQRTNQLHQLHPLSGVYQWPPPPNGEIGIHHDPHTREGDA